MPCNKTAMYKLFINYIFLKWDIINWTLWTNRY